MNYIQKIASIRGRGQLTVPQEIREALGWKSEEMPVKIETVINGFKVEALPVSHPQHPRKKLTEKEWDELRATMKRISKSGRQNISLTKFLRHDRDTRDA